MSKLKQLTNMTTHLRHTVYTTSSGHNPVLVIYQHLQNEKINQQNTILIKEMDNRIKMLENAQKKIIINTLL